MAAAALQQVVDGEVVAVDDADVSAARLVRPASWVEVNMTQRLLINVVFTHIFSSKVNPDLEREAAVEEGAAVGVDNLHQVGV